LRVGRLTCRHLERQFLRTVGVSPKRLARITRFQHALALLGRLDSNRRGTLTAAACGYSIRRTYPRLPRSGRVSAGRAPAAADGATGFFIARRRTINTMTRRHDEHEED
jgi:transcriptional regulator GlxA family with amidase domain